MNKNKEAIIIEESKSVALSILQDEKIDPDNIKKITDSIDYETISKVTGKTIEEIKEIEESMKVDE